MDIIVEEKKVIRITHREMEIIKLLSNGFCSKEIGARFDVSTKTIDSHRYNLMKKMKCRNTVHVIATFLRKGIIV